MAVNLERKSSNKEETQLEMRKSLVIFLLPDPYKSVCSNIGLQMMIQREESEISASFARILYY